MRSTVDLPTLPFTFTQARLLTTGGSGGRRLLAAFSSQSSDLIRNGYPADGARRDSAQSGSVPVPGGLDAAVSSGGAAAV